MWFDLWGVRNFTATRHFLFLPFVGGRVFYSILDRRDKPPGRSGRRLRSEELLFRQSSQVLELGDSVPNFLCRAGIILYKTQCIGRTADMAGRIIIRHDVRAFDSGLRPDDGKVPKAGLRWFHVTVFRYVHSLRSKRDWLSLQYAGNRLAKAWVAIAAAGVRRIQSTDFELG
jgi:hypothetical protein